MHESVKFANQLAPDADVALQQSARVLVESAPLVLHLLRELASIIGDDVVLDWVNSEQAELQLLTGASFTSQGAWFESGQRVWSIIAASASEAAQLHSVMCPPRWGCQPLPNTAEHTYASLVEEWALLLAHPTMEFTRRLGLSAPTGTGPSWERHCVVHNMVQNIVGAGRVAL